MSDNLDNHSLKPYEEVDEAIQLLDDIIQHTPLSKELTADVEQKSDEIIHTIIPDVDKEEKVFTPIVEDIPSTQSKDDLPEPASPVVMGEDKKDSLVLDTLPPEQTEAVLKEPPIVEEPVIHDIVDQQRYADEVNDVSSSFEDTASSLDAKKYSPAFIEPEEAPKTMSKSLDEMLVVEQTEPRVEKKSEAPKEEYSLLQADEPDALPDEESVVIAQEAAEDSKILIDLPEEDEDGTDEPYVIEQGFEDLDAVKESGLIEDANKVELPLPPELLPSEGEIEEQDRLDAEEEGFVSDPYDPSLAYSDTNQYDKVGGKVISPVAVSATEDELPPIDAVSIESSPYVSEYDKKVESETEFEVVESPEDLPPVYEAEMPLSQRESFEKDTADFEEHQESLETEKEEFAELPSVVNDKSMDAPVADEVTDDKEIEAPSAPSPFVDTVSEPLPLPDFIEPPLADAEYPSTAPAISEPVAEYSSEKVFTPPSSKVITADDLPDEPAPIPETVPPFPIDEKAPVAEKSEEISEEQEEALEEYEEILQNAKREADEFISAHASPPQVSVPEPHIDIHIPDQAAPPDPEIPYDNEAKAPPSALDNILAPPVALPLQPDEQIVKEKDSNLSDIKYKSVPLDSSDGQEAKTKDQSLRSFLSKFKKKKDRGEESE